VNWILRCSSHRTNCELRTLNAVCGNNLSVLRSIQNTDALCGKNVGFLNGKADGTSSIHWTRCEVVRWYVDFKDKDGSHGLLVVNLTDITQCTDVSGVPGRCPGKVAMSGVPSTYSLNRVLDGLIVSAFCRVTNFIVRLTAFLGIVLFCAQVFTCFINLQKLHCRPVRVVYCLYTGFTHNL